MFKSAEDQIKAEAKKVQEMETRLVVLQNNLVKNKEFQEFITLQNSINNKAASIWSDIEQKMIDHDIKSIDMEWVKLTIVKSSTLEVLGVLAPKFTKRVPDTKKINAYIAKTGEVPEGIEKKSKVYLRKTFRPYVS
jgi:hypothetical protein